MPLPSQKTHLGADLHWKTLTQYIHILGLRISSSWDSIQAFSVCSMRSQRSSDFWRVSFCCLGCFVQSMSACVLCSLCKQGAAMAAAASFHTGEWVSECVILQFAFDFGHTPLNPRLNLWMINPEVLTIRSKPPGDTFELISLWKCGA